MLSSLFLLIKCFKINIKVNCLSYCRSHLHTYFCFRFIRNLFFIFSMRRKYLVPVYYKILKKEKERKNFMKGKNMLLLLYYYLTYVGCDECEFKYLNLY